MFKLLRCCGDFFNKKNLPRQTRKVYMFILFKLAEVSNLNNNNIYVKKAMHHCRCFIIYSAKLCYWYL